MHLALVQLLSRPAGFLWIRPVSVCPPALTRTDVSACTFDCDFLTRAAFNWNQKLAPLVGPCSFT